jgi:hypothetical protein
MLDNYRDLIDELLGTPGAVRSAAVAGGEDALRLIAAMRARDLLVLERVQRIKNQRDPHLKPLPAMDELAASATPSASPQEEIDRFEVARGDLVSLLMNLTLRDWERTATTDAEGVITLSDEVEAHVEFDEAQRARLESLAG